MGDFIAIIMLTPGLSVSNPALKPMFLSKIGNVERLAGKPLKSKIRNQVNNIQYFAVSKSHYVHFNSVANFPKSLDEIEEYVQNT